jgi:hypothetical protein
VGGLFALAEAQKRMAEKFAVRFRVFAFPLRQRNGRCMKQIELTTLPGLCHAAQNLAISLVGHVRRLAIKFAAKRAPLM